MKIYLYPISVVPKWGLLDNIGTLGTTHTLPLCFQESLVGGLYGLILLMFSRSATPCLRSIVTFPFTCTFFNFKGSIPSFTKFGPFMFLFQYLLSSLVVISIVSKKAVYGLHAK